VEAMTLKSMTGFGRYQQDDGSRIQIWEVRSVNSRYLDPKWRLPAQVRSLESSLEKMLRRHAVRGRVEISLTLQATGEEISVNFDRSLASALLNTLSDFAHSRGDVFQPDYGALLDLSQLWIPDAPQDKDALAQSLEKGLTAALEDWNNARLAEGANLVGDLRQRFATMDGWMESLAKRAPTIKEERFRQVRERLAEILSHLGGELDDSRFLQEMVIMADKLDVSEELARLRSHLKRLDQLLDQSEDSGRKLDFTLQECFREINTCGNKIQDAEMSRLVVDFKNELEKCREQVQNLE
jgi:uncharacterized protein (TIGR00255 family)